MHAGTMIVSVPKAGAEENKRNVQALDSNSALHRDSMHPRPATAWLLPEMQSQFGSAYHGAERSRLPGATLNLRKHSLLLRHSCIKLLSKDGTEACRYDSYKSAVRYRVALMFSTACCITMVLSSKLGSSIKCTKHVVAADINTRACQSYRHSSANLVACAWMQCPIAARLLRLVW